MSKCLSGGSWAAAVFTYAQNRSLDDLHYLGDVVFPSDMTIQSLKSMDSDCARSFVNRDMMRIASSALHNGEANTVTESWRLPCSKVYLEPLGVDVGSLF